jgi:7-cyano-7-deazaguanine synthase
MDSSTLLLRCLDEYDTVVALSFDYGQKHSVELEKAKALVNYINDDFDYQRVIHQIIKLDGLSELLNSNLVWGGKEVPEGHYKEENMKDTVVPNRNKIFSSIIQAVALSMATKNGKGCDIAMGIHSGDHDIYPDCRQEFRDLDFEAFKSGNWDSELVGHFTPYLDGDKFDILVDGEKLCKKLELNFDEVYKRTMTSYKPIYCRNYGDGDLKPGPYYAGGGMWCSDYKSASSVERVEAFIKLGRPDPAPYADETGIVGWEKVVQEVSKVLNNHK